MILIFLVNAFLSCKKQKSCPAFNPKDAAEFSYTKPDTLIFENEESEQFKVFISSIKMSESYTYECKDLHNICPCINYIEALATDSRRTKQYSFLRMEQSDVSDMQYFKYKVRGFEFEFDFRNELPYIDQMEHLKYYSSMTIGSKKYKDIICITNFDPENTSAIYQVFFTKNEGVLRFSEKTSNQAWSLVN